MRKKLHAKRYTLNAQIGQTLVEVVIAAGVLAVIMGLVGIAAYSSIRQSYQGQLREQATYLGQEGIEIIKNYKDRNWGISETGSYTCPPAPGRCHQPIVVDPIAVDDLFKNVSGVFCISYATASQRWYLNPPSSADPDDCTTGSIGSESGTSFIRYATISANRAGHAGGIQPPNPCSDPASPDSCFIRKVVVTVKWCEDGSPVTTPGCTFNSTDILTYLYKWKDPSYG